MLWNGTAGECWSTWFVCKRQSPWHFLVKDLREQVDEQDLSLPEDPEEPCQSQQHWIDQCLIPVKQVDMFMGLFPYIYIQLLSSPY